MPSWLHHSNDAPSIVSSMPRISGTPVDIATRRLSIVSARQMNGGPSAELVCRSTKITGPRAERITRSNEASSERCSLSSSPSVAGSRASMRPICSWPHCRLRSRCRNRTPRDSAVRLPPNATIRPVTAISDSCNRPSTRCTASTPAGSLPWMPASTQSVGPATPLSHEPSSRRMVGTSVNVMVIRPGSLAGASRTASRRRE